MLISIAFNSVTKLEDEIYVLLHSAGTKAYRTTQCDEAQARSKPTQNRSVQKQTGSQLLPFDARERFYGRP